MRFTRTTSGYSLLTTAGRIPDIVGKPSHFHVRSVAAPQEISQYNLLVPPHPWLSSMCVRACLYCVFGLPSSLSWLPAPLILHTCLITFSWIPTRPLLRLAGRSLFPAQRWDMLPAAWAHIAGDLLCLRLMAPTRLPGVRGSQPESLRVFINPRSCAHCPTSSLLATTFLLSSFLHGLPSSPPPLYMWHNSPYIKMLWTTNSYHSFDSRLIIKTDVLLRWPFVSLSPFESYIYIFSAVDFFLFHF